MEKIKETQVAPMSQPTAIIISAAAAENSNELSLLQKERLIVQEDPLLLQQIPRPNSRLLTEQPTPLEQTFFDGSQQGNNPNNVKYLNTHSNSNQPNNNNNNISQNSSHVPTRDQYRQLQTLRGIQPDLTKPRWQFVKKFIDRIKIYSTTVKFTQCNKAQLEIINDLSFNFETFYQKDTFVNQNSVPSRIWDTIQFVFLLIYIIYLPIRLAFDALNDDPIYFYFFEVIPNVLQIINMFLEFNTGYYSNGLVIRDRKQIFFNYLSKKFMYDIVLNVCWCVSLQEGSSEWLKAVGMLRLVIFVYLITEMEETFSIREIFGSYFDLFKLGGFIFLSAHLIGCCWYALAIYEESIGVSVNWLSKDTLNYDPSSQASPALRGYIASFYWSIVTMCTVGYGDIGPTTYIERVFVIVTVLLSSFIFGFSMNQIGEILSNLRQSNEEFKSRMTQLNLYMKKRRLNKMMQHRVTRYYQYLYLEEKEDNQVGRSLIEDLPPFLRDEVKKDISRQHISTKDLFAKNFSQQLRSKLYKITDESKLGSEEYLFKAGGIPQKLFLILKGEVSMILQDRVSIRTYRTGQFVGAMEFFSNKKYDLSAKTTQFTQIATIDKQDFMDLVNSRPEDIESFAMVRDNVLMYKNTQNLGVVCESCGKFGHLFQNCNLIQFHQNKQKQIYQYNSAKQITRLRQERPVGKTRTLLNLSVIQGTVTGFNEFDPLKEELVNGIPKILMEGDEDCEEDLEEKTGDQLIEKDTAEVKDSLIKQELKQNEQKQKSQSLRNQSTSQRSQEFSGEIIKPRKRLIINKKTVLVRERSDLGRLKQVLPIDQALRQSGNVRTPRSGNALGGLSVSESGQLTVEKSIEDFNSADNMDAIDAMRERTIENLDAMREFDLYFKHNNYQATIQSANRLNEKNAMYQHLIRRAKSQARVSSANGRGHARKKAISSKVENKQYAAKEITFMQ